MQIPLFLLRLLLAGVFAYAAVQKLRDRDGTRQNLVDFGAPERLAPAGAWLLPLAELLVALLLIPPATALAGALGALALLAIFIAAIGANLILGRRPSCSCFGARHASPISVRMLGRNGLLAALAAVVAFVEPGFVRTSLIAASSFSLVALTLGLFVVTVVAAQSLLLFRVFRQNQRLLKQISRISIGAKEQAPSSPESKPVGFTTIADAMAGLRPGTAAPDFTLENLDGHEVSLLSLLRPGKPLVLVFGDPTCGPCRAMMPDVGLWHRQHPSTFDVVLISRGSAEANRAKFPYLPGDQILIQEEREAANAYGAVGTPSAVLVTPDRTIGRPLANAEVEIRRLIRSIVRADAPQTVDERAPAFTLPDVDEHEVNSEQFRGKPVALFFSGRNCGLCKRILPDVRKWESRPLTERAPLLVVSGGSADEGRAMELSSTIVLDSGGELRKDFGVPGTPGAALVDSAGYVVKKGSGQTAVLGILAAATWESNDQTAIAQPPPVQATQTHKIKIDRLAGTTPVKDSCVTDEWLADGSIVLYNSCRNKVVTLNATGALIWECCDGSHTLDGIAAEMRDVFPAADGVENNVREVLEGLLRDEMITANRASPEQAAVV